MKLLLLKTIEYWVNWHWPRLFCLLYWGTILYPKGYRLKKIDKKTTIRGSVKNRSALLTWEVKLLPD